MPFKSYLVEKFDFTHENQFFRKFSENLRKQYSSANGEHILIGNLSCNGHLIDAVFIANGQITVLDFKDYEGILTFSENNPWRMQTPSEEIVFVKGGAKSRNPFQQVRAYRFSLADYLQENQDKILNNNRSDIHWYHIGCFVLFQRKVDFDNDELSPKINRYFQVHDKDSIIDALEDRHTEGLTFTDKEIQRILEVLDISEDNLLGSATFDEEEGGEETNNRVSEEKLSLIKKLTKDNEASEPLAKILSYYKILVNLERYKEPIAKDLRGFPLDMDQNFSNYNLDLTASPKFHNKFLENRQKRFPDNIFTALNVMIDGKPYPLLYDITMVSDIEDSQALNLNFNSFGLYINVLDQMGLGEDLIEILSTAINSVDSIDEKLEVISEHLEVSAELSSEISVGFSQEALYSAQLQSELRKLVKGGDSHIDNKLFEQFLRNKSITVPDDKLQLDPFVAVRKLNQSQEKAVKMAFQKPLSVITGPPGTGKSEVVLNTMANGIVNNHSVAFVSKNNKAVDTVKQRMNDILTEPYLIRLGSRSEIESNTTNQLNSILTNNSNGEFDDNESQLLHQRSDLKSDLKKIKDLRDAIDRIPLLEEKITNIETNIDQLESESEEWFSSLNENYKKLFVTEKCRIDVDLNEIGRLSRVGNQYNSNPFSRFIFSLFLKSKILKKIKSIHQSQPEQLRSYLDLNAPYFSANEPFIMSGNNFLQELLKLSSIKHDIDQKREHLESSMNQAEEQLQNLHQELLELIEKKSEYEKEIQSIEHDLPEKSRELLNLTVQQRLHDLSSPNLQRYLEYIPANQVWKNEEIKAFEACSKLFLEDFNAVCLTNLSIKNGFPLRPNLFDLLIVDEASQCDIASALPLIYRAKRLMVIGDSMQLKHITSVRNYEERYLTEALKLEHYKLDYTNNSLYDYCWNLANKSQFESVFLDEHYRCHPEIINFSNHYFYKLRLGSSMKIMTSDEAFGFNNKGIHWHNIAGDMNTSANINQSEVKASVELAIKLLSQNQGASIGIITPFKDQKKAIFDHLPNQYREQIKVDTVHQYQGDEQDIIIFSTVVTTNSPSGKAWFINHNDYLINVAVTRAKNSLYVIGNLEYCKSLTSRTGVSEPLASLANYTENLNKVTA